MFPREGGGPLAVEGARRVHKIPYDDLFSHNFRFVDRQNRSKICDHALSPRHAEACHPPPGMGLAGALHKRNFSSKQEIGFHKRWLGLCSVRRVYGEDGCTV